MPLETDDVDGAGEFRFLFFTGEPAPLVDEDVAGEKCGSSKLTDADASILESCTPEAEGNKSDGGNSSWSKFWVLECNMY